MRLIWLFAVLLGTGTLLAAEDEPKPEPKPFAVENVISDAVAGLKPPRWYPELVSFDYAITASSAEVQKHVSHGVALIHAGWDFEAYRHFVAAAKADPECAMAFWGISLSLANPNSELADQRVAAVERMLELVQLGKSTAVEQGQIESLAFLFSNEPERAPEVYEMVAEEFPNNLQLALMAAFMKRDGYDPLLGPGSGQNDAIREVTELLKKNPESQMALSFWVALHAEHPDGTGELRKTVLPRVRELVKAAPEFAPYRELVGHFEWRAGNLQLAKQEFEKAVELYQSYLAAEDLAYYDCPNLIRAQLYLATVHKSLGDYDAAFAIAKSLQNLSVSKDRLRSPGATLVLWEGRTLSARLHLARGWKSDFKAGLNAMPSLKEGKSLLADSPAVMAWEAWREVLSARDAIGQKAWERTEKSLEGLAASDALLATAGPIVTQGSGRQEWARTRQALKAEWMIAQAEMKLAREGKKGRGQASFWLQSAVDEQVPPRGIFPPIILSSPRLALAEFETRTGNDEKALEIYRGAMRDFPNDVSILKAFASYQKSQGKNEAAEKMLKHIKLVTEPAS